MVSSAMIDYPNGQRITRCAAQENDIFVPCSDLVTSHLVTSLFGQAAGYWPRSCFGPRSLFIDHYVPVHI